MELRVLKYFLAVAREENITRAAALLHLTQPTLSRQLMQLEEELGVKLFHRSRYRIVLTEDGMLLRRRAQELVELAEKTAQEFRRTPELRGTVAIGGGETWPLAQKQAVTAQDLAGVPLLLTARGAIQQELARWFGPYAQRIQVAATGNLPHNLTLLAQEGMGAFLTIRLRSRYEGLRFLPLSPPLTSGTVLAWKKTEAFPPVVAALLEHIKQCLFPISADGDDGK